jgi:mono/diheme cytochrome c family protein
MTQRTRVLLLSLATVVLVAVTLAGCGSGASVTTGAAGAAATTSTGSSASALAEGKSIFSDNCVRCHGASGQGVTGPSLQNETDIAKVTNQVRNGGQRMPSFGGKLSDAQVTAVVQYVLSFAGN